MGRSIIFIVDVDGVVVTLAYQGVDAVLGAPEDGFDTYQETGLAIIDSIIWGTPSTRTETRHAGIGGSGGIAVVRPLPPLQPAAITAPILRQGR